MSLTTRNEQVETDNRRLHARGPIRGVVLVFFGVGKWGRLTNISEGGMAFEFYQFPPSNQRISFSLDLMDSEAPKYSGKLDTLSVRVDGQIVWTRDFERCAGVRFLDVSEDVREHIRQWFSIETSFSAAIDKRGVQRDPTGTGLPERPLALHDTSDGTNEGESWNAELAESSSPKIAEGAGVNEQHTLEEPSSAGSQIDRAALMSTTRWLAGLAILAAITIIILSQRVHLAALFERIRERSVGNTEPHSSGEGSLARNRPVFQVEAVDANNRRRLLTFDNDASAVQPWLSSGTERSRTQNKPFSVNEAINPAETTKAETRQSLSTLKLGSPTVTRAATNASPEDPLLAVDLRALSREPFGAINPSGAILPNSAQQVPAVPPLPDGGTVQQARLISSVSPVYPPFARSLGLQGDITIDALIDSTGKVTTMKPLSGPVPLQQAAMDALRQWNYEPARVHSRPVSTHVSVTIRFRLN
jgi:TonB family protein